MNNLTSKDYKRAALNSLTKKWFMAFLASLVASLCGASGGTGISFNFGGGTIDTQSADTTAIEQNIEQILPIIIAIVIAVLIFALIVGAAMLIIGSAVSIGYAQFNLDLVRGYEANIGTLFSKFGQIKAAICARLLMALKIFLGSLLFIIPGVIASYKYAMVSYLLADDPGLTAKEALRRSDEIMMGNKWRLFCLHFSFIGWILLTLITLGIASIWIVPYQQAAIAAFYESIRPQQELPSTEDFVPLAEITE